MLRSDSEILSPARGLAQEVEQVVDFCDHFVLAGGVPPDLFPAKAVENA
jgi:hypothetical protein